MRKVLNLVFIFVIMLTLVACDDKDDENPVTPLDPIETEGTPLKLWYDEETPKDGEGNAKGWMLSWGDKNVNDKGWTNWSLPIGNGYFGVNVFGRTETERIQITDKTLSNPWQSPGTYKEEGGLNNFSETYLDFNHTNSEVSNYERYLDLNTAISGVKYDYEGVTYTREYIASYPDKALVIYLDSSEEGALDFTLRPTVPFEKSTASNGFTKDGQVESWVDGEVGVVELTGTLDYYGIDFMAMYKVYTEGGEVTADVVSEELSENQNGGSHSEIGDGTIVVSGATRAYIVVTLGTDYELESGIFLGGQHDRNKPTQKADIDDVRIKVEGYMEAVEEMTYDLDVKGAYSLLRERHVDDYRELFGRVSLELDYEEADLETTTDILQFRASIGQISRYLEGLFFQYGRYLLIASSRPGTLPAHLQGAWNCYDIPPWSSGYWHNINLQMNYWPAFTTNLAETFDAYVDFNKAYMEQAEYLASNEVRYSNPDAYGKDGGNGWTIGVANNPFFINSDSSSGNMAFTTQLFWDYYAYTLDEEVLENSYKVLANAARFITKCVKQYEDGYYLVMSADSPEQHVNGVWYKTVGPTYAQSLSYLNNYYTLLAAKELGIDLEDSDLLSEEEYSILSTILEQIDKYDPINVGLSGQVKEFREENYYGDLGDPSHRHISQLVGLYPGNLITSNTPAWIDASAVTLEGRSGFSDKYGWVYSHKMSLYSRIKDGNSAYEEFHKLLKNSITPNLWTKYEEIYQAESNYGATAGVAEMLLQSHEGYIDILPALPSAWNSGTYTGLVAQGNFEVSCSWDKSLANKVSITANKGGNVKVKYPLISTTNLVDSKGNKVDYSVVDTDMIEFETKEGETYYISGFTSVKTLKTPTNFTYTKDGSGQFNFTWDSVKDAVSYNVYKAVGNASTYTLIDNVENTSLAYMPEANETNTRTTFVVTAVDSNGRESKRTLCYFNPQSATNVFENKKFTPTQEALNCVYPAWDNTVDFGYNNLTDGKFGELEGRYSSNTSANSIFDATIELGNSCKLGEIRIYDYKGDYTYAGNNLSIKVYSNGNWVEVIKVTSNASLANYRSGKVNNTGYKYLSFNLNGIEGEKVRIYISGAMDGKSISFYEIECYGKNK